MKQQIFIVTNGDYSSYEIVACFRTLESAQKYCRTLRLNRLKEDIESTADTMRRAQAWLDWLDGKRGRPTEIVWSRNLDTIIGGHNPIVDMEWDNENGGWIRSGPEKQIENAKIRFHSELITRISKCEEELKETAQQLDELPQRDFREGGEWGENIIETHDLWDDPIPALEKK